MASIKIKRKHSLSHDEVLKAVQNLADELSEKLEHSLSHDEVLKAVQNLADELSEKLEADYEWEGDNLSFKRSGASGKVCVGKKDLEVDIKLSMLLTPLKGKIEQTVNDYLDENLA